MNDQIMFQHAIDEAHKLANLKKWYKPWTWCVKIVVYVAPREYKLDKPEEKK